jgi:lipid kinase YegS
MLEKCCLILHRKSANRADVKEAVNAVRKSGVRLRVRIPWNRKDKSRVVREAIEAGATRIIAGGGDGTVNAVVGALVGDGSEPPEEILGVLPLGTANDFARGQGLPVEDVTECLRLACTVEPRPTDIGMVNGRPFINVASGGFGAEVTATTPEEMKLRLGGLAYTIMGLMKIIQFQPYHGKLFIPGEQPREGNMLLMAVGNSSLAGGGFAVAPKAVTDDGLLDLMVFHHEPGTSLAGIAAELQEVDNAENKHLNYLQLPEFCIEVDSEMYLNVDGEPFLGTRFEFTVLKRHVKLAIPPASFSVE